MKARYVLFTLVAYSNAGSWGDFCDSSDDLDALIRIAEKHLAVPDCDGWNIIDLTTFEKVAEG